MVNTQQLISSRIQLHYAIQFMAAISNALAPPQPDGSHVTINWEAKQQLFVSVLIAGLFKVALDPIGLNALLLDPQGNQIEMLPLEGQTMDEGLEWHRTEIGKLGLDASNIVFLDYPPNDFPDHEVAHGGVFEIDPLAARIWLMNYFQTSQNLLQDIVANLEEASDLHIWPHHFDMATLLSWPTNQDGESGSIGVGFSPGDAGYPEPYWYVSPWPYPNIAKLPTLVSGGSWHTEEWVGAVLTDSCLGDVTTDATQQSIKTFLSDAVAKSRQLLNE
ncbi:hypothetical protein [Acaryochloris marina]|uniref:hypothetical protein n=1 Tax=Acaryochloris marina TaxID=155978 RepID=UPI0021C4371D|nr:hypothetical protein [Acaryochloris marina]BDM83301.1 hypothetical protein AM10699_61620 [Acaryochloris marina MBIC10699]